MRYYLVSILLTLLLPSEAVAQKVSQPAGTFNASPCGAPGFFAPRTICAADLPSALISMTQATTDKSTNAATTAWVNNYWPVTVGVADWTGTPGSGTNNQPAFQTYLTASCNLVLPPGRFRLTSGLSTTCQPFSIRGAGPGVTELVFDGTVATGILVDGSGVDSDVAQVTFSDLTISTTQTHAGVAAWVKQYPNLNFHRSSRHVSFNNVVISGDATYTQGWGTGLQFTDTEQVFFSHITLIGQGGQSFPNNTEVLNSQSSTAINIIDSVEVVPAVYNIENSNIYNWTTGIQAIGTNQTLQGLAIINSSIVGVRDGIMWTANPSGQPLLQVTNSHINAWRSVATTNGVVSIQISDNLFYIDPTTSESSVNMLDISNTTNCGIHNNQFWQFVSTAGGLPGIGVLLRANVKFCDILSNQFYSVTSSMASGIKVATDVNSTFNHIRGGNIFDGTFTGATIVDGNSLSTSRLTQGAPGALVYRSTTLSIPNNTGTLLTYASTEYDTDGFLSGSNLVIPSGAGYRRAVICAAGQWASSTSAIQQLFITKGGVTTWFPGQAVTQTSATAATSYQSICTGPIDTTGGDQWGAAVLQNSGGAVNFQNYSLSIQVLD